MACPPKAAYDLTGAEKRDFIEREMPIIDDEYIRLRDPPWQACQKS